MEEFAKSFFEEVKPLIKEIREQENEETSKKDIVPENNVNSDEVKQEADKDNTKQELKKQLQDKTEKFISDYEGMIQEETKNTRDKLELVKEKKKQTQKELKKANNKLKKLKESDSEKADLLNEHIELLTKDLENLEESEKSLISILGEYENEQNDFHEIMGSINFENDEYLSIFEKIIERDEKEFGDKSEENQETIENNNASEAENPNIQENTAGNELEEFFEKVEKYHPISEDLKLICRKNPEFANLMFQQGDNFYKEAVLAVLYQKFSENYDRLSKEIDEIITVQKRKENITRLKPEDYTEERPAKIKTMYDIKRKPQAQGHAEPKTGEKPGAKAQGHAEPKTAEPKIDIADQNMKIVIKPDQDEIFIYMKDQEKSLRVTNILKRIKEGKELSIGKYFTKKNIDRADPSILSILEKLEEKGICKGVIDEYLESFESQETKQIDSIQYIFDRKSDKAKNYKKIEKHCKKYAKAGIETGIVDVENIKKEKGKFAKFVDKVLYKLTITKTPKYLEGAEEKEDLSKTKKKSKAEERSEWLSRMNNAVIENPTRTFQGTKTKPKEKDDRPEEESVR